MSISDRPGLGRSPASNGAACVALPKTVIVEAGYRDQTTRGPGTQTLSTIPNIVVRFGLAGNSELLIALPTYSERSGFDYASGLSPASGTQDTGFGFKHLLYDGAALQDAVNVFVTIPTGSPAGTSGFTAGLPTVSLGYSAVWTPPGRLGFSSTQNVIADAAPVSAAPVRRFFAYQPSVSASYTISPALTFLLQNQWSFPYAPGAGSGDRALAGLQIGISPNVVLDADVETNLLPPAGLSQRAVDLGITVRP